MTELTDEMRCYKAHLCKTDVSRNSNKFYDMEIIEASGENKFAVKLINGRIGYKGVTRFQYFQDSEKAIKFFEKQFHSKTDLEWEERNDEPVPGKYNVVKLEMNKENENVKQEPKPVEPPKPVTRKRRGQKTEEVKQEEEFAIVLEQTVREFMKIICDEDRHLGLLRQLQFNEGYGKPLDILSMEQLDLGFVILDEIEKALSVRSKTKDGIIMQKTNAFYSLIPHIFGFSVPPKIDSVVRVMQERELLDALKGTMDAADGLRKCRLSKDIYLSMYQRLPTAIEPVGPEDAKILSECVTLKGPTHNWDIKMAEAFKVVYRDEVIKKRPRKTGTLMLWHGTRVTNVYSILMNGLMLPRGNRFNLMFGNGIYFANVPSKSANYCDPEKGSKNYLLLCEVFVGKQLDVYESDTTVDKQILKAKKDSVYAHGKWTPRETLTIHNNSVYKGGLEEIDHKTDLLYDEFIVFREDQFKIRYIVEIDLKKKSVRQEAAPTTSRPRRNQ